MSSTTTAISPLRGSYRSALTDANWHATMSEEYQALMDNDTWQLVPRPPHANVVTEKLIFKHKFHSNGSLVGHNA